MKIFLCAMLAAMSFEIIDRVAVTVEDRVITESELRKEIRVMAFLDGAQPDLSGANRRKAAERLVEQYLMRREMRFTRYPEPEPEEIAAQMEQVRARFKSEGDYRAALDRAGITEADVREAITRALAVVHFIDLRFRPEVQALEPELMEYFQKECLPAWKKTHSGPDPTFDELRSECEEAMVSQRVDQRVEDWLKEVRGRSRIHFEEDAFK
ncbi:MAG TPA: hypothetical protein VN428_02780 [Bryobacteraceae bacterium]|nr:hypothetical protein [Bryobacteraceae bacterium]